jgi:hypothetical protein
MELCMQQMLTIATFFTDPNRDFKRAEEQIDYERKKKMVVAKNPKTVEERDEINLEVKTLF